MNKVELLGRLTRDPEVRYAQSNNMMVVNFSLAVNRRFQREGDTQTADFINIVAFGKTAEFISKYFKKGQQVAICGRIQTRTWDDPQGQKRYITEVIAEEVDFADSRRNSEADNFNDTFGGANASSSQAEQGSDGQNSDFEVSSGDDLPF